MRSKGFHWIFNGKEFITNIIQMPFNRVFRSIWYLPYFLFGLNYQFSLPQKAHSLEFPLHLNILGLYWFSFAPSPPVQVLHNAQSTVYTQFHPSVCDIVKNYISMFLQLHFPENFNTCVLCNTLMHISSPLLKWIFRKPCLFCVSKSGVQAKHRVRFMYWQKSNWLPS